MATNRGASAASVRAPRDHAVQFYEGSESFLDSVSAFLAAGLAAGDPGVVIATEEHRRGLEDRLAQKGLDLETARATGRYRPLDAAETMSKFLVGSTVDEARFRRIVGAALARSNPRHGSRPVRVFGEMVAVLCSRGMSDAALRVEQLWNELAVGHSFSLLCAYPMDGFATAEQSDAFSKICLEHTRVIPVEHYSDRADADRKTRVIAELQRKAAALEREMALRREAEESVRRRERELDDMNRRKDEFLAMLGHELRNPMSPIVTALHVVRLKPNDPAILSRSLEVVERNFQRVTRLVDDFLDVSRITSGKIDLREERVALSAIVERAVEQSRAALEERGHRLSLSLPEEPITLRADPTRLEQVLVNLLINAAKYTDFGGRVALSVAREGEEAVLRVRDNGIGMSPEVCERVFELFAQGPHASGSRPAGLGVGLTLVRRLVELHGGTVVARSDGPGQGSELVVRLPIRQPAPSVEMGAFPAPSSPKPRRVLVVDDNEDVAQGLAEYFRAIGHEVRTARDGPSAIAESARLRPEIAFLDIGMPDMDGHELAGHLRAMESLRGIRLIALTGYGQESDRLRAQAAGFDHHLVKPVDFAKLERLLDLEMEE